MANQQAIISKGVNWILVWLYIVLVAVGFIAIFSVEHRASEQVMDTILHLKTNYARQLMFIAIFLVLGVFILLTDSKFFTATANLSYAFGIFLMLITFVIGKNVNGSRSWLPLGFVSIQPAELCKVFVSLALAKYLSRTETDFTKPQSQLIAATLCLAPAALSILQNETGLALVYFSFIIVLYREGLPPWYLITGFYLAVLAVASLVLDPNLLAKILIGLAIVTGYFLKRRIKRDKKVLVLIVIVLAISVGIERFAMPYVLNNVFQCYQSERIMSLVGQEYDCAKNKHFNAPIDPTKKPHKASDDYNVKQSKIAIGSGGLLGKGFLKGSVTQGDFVPEQHTDFIFTAIGESFGFWGTALLLSIYFLLLMIIVSVAERQRSTFSRVYAYCVASIMFFHIMVNVCMTVGLAPVIGIPLPMISYGGSSLLTFTVLIFILIRLDADRQMVLR